MGLDFQNQLKEITIVGCGSVGSILSSMIMQNTNITKYVDNIKLYDCDVLEKRNLPYVTIKDNRYNGYPKSLVLERILNNFKKEHYKSEHVRIKSFIELFDILKPYDKKENEIMMDCRDTDQQSNLFDIKLLSEGKYGKIVVNSDKCYLTNNLNNYTFVPNQYHNMKISKLANNILYDIIKNKEIKKGTFIIDLEN